MIAPGTIRFKLNGHDAVSNALELVSYEEICKLTALDPKHNPSITIAYRSEYADRCLTHGQSAPLNNGAIINACYTGNA